ncbi:MAG: NAD(P)-dependent alcohol dehydrogenase [Ignavibacteriales bacterium]|nr:NAD(P)-dependent alcohol dehydrogenase [Ignavibacteriales bacterium]
MKAIVYHNYGSPDVLKCEEVEKPTPGDNEVLIQVRAASVNPLDWHFVRGIPYFLRIMAGVRKPKSTRLGVDLAGKVEAVGRNVTRFKPGDEVFGTGHGAFAEYACSTENKLALKPARLTFEQAAAVPVAAITALQGLRDKGQIQPGQRVLINGAAGGVGTFAVQIAKSLGVHVTGVCSTRNVDLVKSVGADHVIDYTKEDFAQKGERYDLILDNVGNRSFDDCRRVMVAKGILVSNGGGSLKENEGSWLGPITGSIAALALSPFMSQKMVTILASITNTDLTALRELMDAGKVTPVIDRSYRLIEVPDAIRHVEEGHARGKVVITMGQSS